MQSFSTFIPPERTLMGPGPSDVNPRILNAMARPTLGHLDPLFIVLRIRFKKKCSKRNFLSAEAIPKKLNICFKRLKP